VVAAEPGASTSPPTTNSAAVAPSERARASSPSVPQREQGEQHDAVVNRSGAAALEELRRR
jgi:hypothetical protein